MPSTDPSFISCFSDLWNRDLVLDPQMGPTLLNLGLHPLTSLPSQFFDSDDQPMNVPLWWVMSSTPASADAMFERLLPDQRLSFLNATVENERIPFHENEHTLFNVLDFALLRQDPFLIRQLATWSQQLQQSPWDGYESLLKRLTSPPPDLEQNDERERATVEALIDTRLLLLRTLPIDQRLRLLTLAIEKGCLGILSALLHAPAFLAPPLTFSTTPSPGPSSVLDAANAHFGQHAVPWGWSLFLSPDPDAALRVLLNAGIEPRMDFGPGYCPELQRGPDEDPSNVFEQAFISTNIGLDFVDAPFSDAYFNQNVPFGMDLLRSHAPCRALLDQRDLRAFAQATLTDSTPTLRASRL